MNFGITRALAGVNSIAELGLVLRSGRHMRAWVDAGRPFPFPMPSKCATSWPSPNFTV